MEDTLFQQQEHKEEISKFINYGGNGINEAFIKNTTETLIILLSVVLLLILILLVVLLVVTLLILRLTLFCYNE